MYTYFVYTHKHTQTHTERQIYIQLPVNVVVRRNSWNWNSQGQETFLSSSTDKQTRNYDTECSNDWLSLSTLRSKGLSRSKMKWWAIHANLQVNVIDYLILGAEIARVFSTLDWQANPQLWHRIFNHHPSQLILRSKELILRQLKWWAI